MKTKLLLVLGLLVALSGESPAQTNPATLLNVSYDPTRELYQDFNPAFAKYWKQKTGQTVNIQQIAWRILATSPRADRWIGSRCCDPRASL